MDVSCGYSEIVPFTTESGTLAEICVDIGAPQSALQEFKSSESCGNFCYNNSDSFVTPTSNRFIYWKIDNQTIDFVEISLDKNLIGNKLRLKFQNTPILDGVNIFETANEIYILIATVSSVFRITLQHPQKLSSQNSGFCFTNFVKNKSNLNSYLPSVFSNLNQENFHNYLCSHILNECYNVGSNNSLSSIPISSCTWLTSNNDSVFALSNSSSGIFLITMSSFVNGNSVTTVELKQNNLIKRLWNGMVPSIIRSNVNNEEICLSLFVSHFKNDYLLFTLCKDFKIRVWSYTKQEIVFVFNLLDTIAKHENSLQNLNDSKSLNYNFISNFNLYKSFLRKAKQTEPNQLIFSTFISSTNLKQFIVFEFNNNQNQLSVDCIANLCAPEVDLIDFFVTPSSIWSLWLNSEGQSVIYSTSIEKNNISNWQKVIFSTSYSLNVNLKSVFLTPRELYIDEIFFRGTFNVETITKAYNIFTRGFEQNISESTSLLENVCYSVEYCIREAIGSREISSNEYTQIEEQCWEKFFGYCIQYKNIGSKPLGLIYDYKTGFLGQVTKDECLFLKMNDNLSEIILNPNANLENFLMTNDWDTSLKRSLKMVLSYLNIISENLNDEAIVDFELTLSNNESIEAYFENSFFNQLLTSTEKNSGKPFKLVFEEFFFKVSNFELVLDLLLKELGLKNDDFDFDQILDDLPTCVNQNFINFMTSINGVSLTCACIHQIARTRLNLCRNLIFLQTILLNLNKKLDIDLFKKIKLFYIPQTASLLHAYHFITWICETTVKIDDNIFLNSSERVNLLSLINLNDYSNINFIEKDQNNEIKNIRSILFYFLQSKGLTLAKKVMLSKFNNLQSLTLFKEVFATMLDCILQVIWPVSVNFIFQEFLLGVGLYDVLIESVDQLDGWCNWNKCSRQFVKGVSFLQTGEPAKAFNCFLKSLNKLSNENFMLKSLQIKNDYLKENEDFISSFDSEIVYIFYQKLVQLFELHSYTDFKIKVCEYALTNLKSIEDDEQYSSAFESMLFMSKLELGNYNSAFNLMQIISSEEQKRNCSRQFIVTLYEKNESERLTNYAYNELEDDFVSIMESKARSSDISLNLKNDKSSYYELLYSYFIKNHNYRKSASTMYEYSQRLFQEVPGIKSLEKQVLSLGLALNSLRIIDEEYSWIIKPTVKILANSNKQNESFKKLNSSILSSKRSYEGNSIVNTIDDLENNLNKAIKRDIEILGIKEIKIEYELAKARLLLLEKDEKFNSIANTYLQADEIINLLINNCMFDLAFKLSIKLNISILKIFNELVNKYIFCVMNPLKLDELFSTIQNWFTENETAALTYISNSGSNLVNKMWLLIFEYINKYEKEKQTTIHKCVIEQFLTAGIPIPYTIKFSYQKKNTSELIFLFMSYNYIEDAVDLALELIDGYLGIGTDYFDINFNVMSDEISYFPNQIYKKLLSILEENQDDSKEFKEMFDVLQKKLNEYKKLSKQASDRILKIKN